MTYTFNIASLIVISILITYILILNRHLKKYKLKDVYLEYLLKYAPLGIYFKDLSGNIKLVNRELVKITGHTKKELLEKTIYDVYPKDFIKDIKEIDSIICKNKNPLSIEKTLKFQNTETHFRIIKSPVINIEGKVIGFIVLLKNIDTEKEIESNKESFIATLTHDLKTPTYAQLNTLKMLLKEDFGSLTPYQKELLELAQNSCKYSLDLISTVLDTYCYDNGKIKLNKQDFNITKLIFTLCRSLESLAHERAQKIIFEPKEEYIIFADELQIKRVITNMLSNAITYGNKNSTIKIKIKKDNTNFKLSVINKSIPIPQKDLSTMFNRFKETKLSCFNKASTGLGLYLSKQIIDMHNGKIFVKSYNDGTCIFGFKLQQSTIQNNNIKQSLTTKTNYCSS